MSILGALYKCSTFYYLKHRLCIYTEAHAAKKNDENYIDIPPNITGCCPDAVAPADEPSSVSAEVLNTAHVYTYTVTCNRNSV